MHRFTLPAWLLLALAAGLLLMAEAQADRHETVPTPGALRDEALVPTGFFGRDACNNVLLQGDTLFYASGRVLEIRRLLPDGESQILGSRVFEESIHELHLNGGLLVVKTLNTVQLLQNQAPGYPRQGVLETWSGYPYTLRTFGNALYLATYNGVDVYDLENPQAPSLVTTLFGGLACYGLELNAGRLFVKGMGAGNQYMLSSFSLEDPLDPEPYAQQPTGPSMLQGMCSREGVLFSIEGFNLVSYDISQAGIIEPLGSIQLACWSFLVTASQEAPLLVVSDYPFGARLLNVSDPNSIAPLPPLGSSPILGTSVDWAGSRLAITTTDPDIQVYDLANPDLPVLSHRVDHGGGAADGLAVCGNRLATSYQGGIVRLMEADRPEELRNVERLDGFSGVPLLASRGSLLAAADSQQVRLVAVSGTAPSVELSRIGIPARPVRVALCQDRLITASADGVLNLWNVEDPTAPQPLTGTQIPGSGAIRLVSTDAGLVVQRGTTVRLLATGEGLPELATLQLATAALDLSADGNRLLVLETSGTVRLFALDGDTPLSPLGSMAAPGSIRASYADGWGWVLFGTGRWQLLDLRDPALPLWDESMDGQPLPMGAMAASGNTLFTINVNKGLQRLRNTLANHAPVLDLAETLEFGEDSSGELLLTGSWTDADLDRPVTSLVQGEVVTGTLAQEHLVVSAPADWNGQDTLVLQLQDGYSELPLEHPIAVTVAPVNDAPFMESCDIDCNTELAWGDPVQVQVQDVDGDSLRVSWFADGELLAEFQLGVDNMGQCLDLPWELVPEGAGLLHAELADADVLVNPDGSLCAWTLQTTGLDHALLPGTWQLGAPAPNPFNPETALEVRAGSAGAATLRVYDVLGRMVDELWQGQLEAGSHHFRWNGNQWASGVYLVMLETPGGRQVQRMTLLK